MSHLCFRSLLAVYNNNSNELEDLYIAQHTPQLGCILNQRSQESHRIHSNSWKQANHSSAYSLPGLPETGADHLSEWPDKQDNTSLLNQNKNQSVFQKIWRNTSLAIQTGGIGFLAGGESMGCDGSWREIGLRTLKWISNWVLDIIVLNRLLSN